MHRYSLPSRRRTQRPLDICHAAKVQPGAEEHDEEIEDAKGPKDAVIQPLVAVKDIDTGRVFIAVCVLAELTETVTASLYVAAGLGDKGGGVGLASLTRGRREASEFCRGANDGTAVGGDGEETFEQIMEGS